MIKLCFASPALLNFAGVKGAFELVWLVILCVLVIAASYYVSKFVGGTHMKKQKNSNFQILDTCPLGNHKYLQLIRIGEKYVVISVCKEAISFITEIEKDEIEILEHEVAGKPKFNDVFAKFINKKNDDDNMTK